MEDLILRFREVTGAARNQLFVFESYLDLFLM